jgi:hypothetical protein
MNNKDKEIGALKLTVLLILDITPMLEEAKNEKR